MVQFVGFLVWAFVMYCISAFFVEQLKAGYISGLYLCIVWFGVNLYMLIDVFIISTIKERREYRKWMEEEPKRMQELRDSVIADGKKLKQSGNLKEYEEYKITANLLFPGEHLGDKF